MASGTIPLPESGSNSNGNYTKFPNGTLIQWGNVRIPKNSTNTPVTFPVSFVDDSESITVTRKYVSSPSVFSTIAGITASGFHIYNTAVANYVEQANWIAVGRWK